MDLPPPKLTGRAAIILVEPNVESMNMKLTPLIQTIACVAIAIAHTACGGGDKKEEAGAGKQGAEPGGSTGLGVLEALVVDEAPEGALGVVAARAAAKPGEPLVLRGKVGGKLEPISGAAAILVLADEESIKSCDQIHGDDCETPWDYCCEESAKIAASTVTIQVKGEDGKLVRSSLRGLAELKELSHLVVAGTVDQASTADAILVNAEKVYVEKP